ncbi:MAG TPA: UbiA-like polyprenyltransferase [Pirellulales bacterium]|jgi:4-hydroxybenzoate polyprenyltransferase|nr:UbiA-like polyprenyltransferase [Pirellulales bacterium]
MFHRLRLLLEMIRFSHTLFALPFALLAAVMAWRDGEHATPWRWQDLAGIVLGMVFARSTAMAFNRLADRHLDAQNPRTRLRHLPAGLLSVAGVSVFAAACAAGFVASTALFLPNRLPLYLSLPVLAFLCGYSLTKRFTALAHFWLGAALMLAPIAAWIALQGDVAWPPVVLGIAVMLWVAGFDMIYACQDVEADTRLNLHSVPRRLGVAGALRLAALCHLGMIGLLFALPWFYPQLGWIYLAGIAVVAGLLAYEHWLVRPDDLTRVNMAFFQVNAVVSVGLFVVGAVDLLVK